MAEFIDITRETCPMTFVRVKLKLAAMQPGEELEVLLNEGEPLQNVPRSAEEAGHAVLGIEDRGDGTHLVRIRK
ncbi:MAG: sulfurtransferase TusA family protein [Mariprofundaceae bacterium]